MLRIRDILVRIRIRGSVPLTNGSGSCSGSGVSDLSRRLQNIIKNQGFSCYFCLIIEESGSVPLTNGSGSGSWRPTNIRLRIWPRIRSTACASKDLMFKFADFVGVILSQVHERRVESLPEKLDLRKKEEKNERGKWRWMLL